MSTLLGTLLLSLAAASGDASAAKSPGPSRSLAIILRGDASTAAGAEFLLDQWAKGRDGHYTRLLAELPAGFPKVVPSDSLKGMRPGYFPIVLGICPAKEGRRVVEVLRKLDPGVYGREVEGAAELCPTLQPSLRVLGPAKFDAHQRTVEATVFDRGGTENVLVVMVRNKAGTVLDRFPQGLECREPRLTAEEDTCEGECPSPDDLLQLVVRGVCTPDGFPSKEPGPYRWIITLDQDRVHPDIRIMFGSGE